MNQASIDISKYKINISLVPDLTLGGEYYDSTVDTDTYIVYDKTKFIPQKMVIRIFPIQPYETIVNFNTNYSMPNLVGLISRIPEEHQVFHFPFKIEVTAYDGTFIIKRIKKAGYNQSIEKIYHHMDIKSMISVAERKVYEKFTSPDEIIRKLHEHFFTI